MKKLIFSILSVILLAGCAGQTAHDTIAPIGSPVGTVLAATQAPIQGASASYATQSARTEQNPYGR